jgi:hypothetical protein
MRLIRGYDIHLLGFYVFMVLGYRYGCVDAVFY